MNYLDSTMGLLFAGRCFRHVVNLPGGEHDHLFSVRLQLWSIVRTIGRVYARDGREEYHTSKLDRILSI